VAVSTQWREEVEYLIVTTHAWVVDSLSDEWVARLKSEHADGAIIANDGGGLVVVAAWGLMVGLDDSAVQEYAYCYGLIDHEQLLAIKYPSAFDTTTAARGRSVDFWTGKHDTVGFVGAPRVRSYAILSCPNGTSTGRGAAVVRTPFGTVLAAAKTFEGVTEFTPLGVVQPHWLEFARRHRGVPLLVASDPRAPYYGVSYTGPVVMSVDEFVAACDSVYATIAARAEMRAAKAQPAPELWELAFAREREAELARAMRRAAKAPTSRIVSGTRRRRNARRRLSR
jgi:hypothetical protein